MRRPAALLAVAAASLAAAAPQAQAAPDARPAPKAKAKAAQSSVTLSPQEARLIELIDAYRRSKGLKGVRVYPVLLNEARWYAADMAFNDSFSVTHIDSLGRTIDQRFWDFGYSIVRPLGQSTSSGKLTADETFEQMRNSRLHDEIIRDPRFELVGAGYGFNPNTDSKAFWVLSFARDIPGQVKKKKASSAARKRKAKASGKRKARAGKARRAAKR